MKTMLEEMWQTKDELARESGYDTHRFFAELRRWAQENPHQGPVVRGAADLARLAQEQARRRADHETMQLNDGPKAKP